MKSSSITPRRRRILVLRHREHEWQKSEATLFDNNGPGLFYGLCLAKEGVGTEEEVYADFETSAHALLALMEEARPEQTPALRLRWEAWFAGWPRR